MNGLLCVTLLTAFGCSSEGAKTETGDDAENGTLTLLLSATDAQGETYRLRNADFSISGYSYATGQYIYTNTSVSSETEPELPVVRTRLLEGYYDVTFLNSGSWYFEHLTAAGAEPVEKAALLGSPTQSTYVYRGSTSPVSFAFGVNGDLVDFLGGQLEIGVTVEQPPFGTGEEAAGGAGG